MHFPSKRTLNISKTYAFLFPSPRYIFEAFDNAEKKSDDIAQEYKKVLDSYDPKNDEVLNKEEKEELAKKVNSGM